MVNNLDLFDSRYHMCATNLVKFGNDMLYISNNIHALQKGEILSETDLKNLSAYAVKIDKLINRIGDECYEMRVKLSEVIDRGGDDD